MPAELALSIVVPIFKVKGDIRDCRCYIAVKLLEHGMKVVERVLEKRLCRIVYVDEMQFGFMPEKGTVVAVFILCLYIYIYLFVFILQEEYHAE